MHQETPPSKVASNDQLGHADETRCMCGEMLLSACPGEWEPGCDLGNNPAHAWPAPAVLDTTDSEVLREALAVAWGDSMTAQLKCNDQAAEIERLRAKLGQLVLPAIEAAVAAERERCARICDGIGAGYTGAARRLDGRHATHAAGQRDGSNECAAAIRRA